MVKRLIDGIYRGLQFLLTFLMGLLIVPVCMQILSRFTGFVPRYIWTEEAARLCFIWIIMLGSMIAVRDDTHFDLEVLSATENAARPGTDAHGAPRHDVACCIDLRVVRLRILAVRL